MRVFIGIKIDDKVKKKINNYFNLYYENKVRGNYTKLSNLHMTIVFIGEVDDNKIPLIKKIIKEVNYKINEIHLTKTAKLKDILVCEAERNKEIFDIYHELNKKLQANGFNVEDKELYPHITFIRKVENGDKFVGQEINLYSCFSHITLFESKRTNNDLVYIDLGE